MKSIFQLFFWILGFSIFANGFAFESDEPKDLTAQLKELLPKIIGFEGILEKSKVNDTITTEHVNAIKEMKDQIKNIDGNILKMDKAVVQLGKRRIEVQPTGMTKEQKIDFAKFFIAVGKCKDGNVKDETVGKTIKDITGKYMGDEAGQKALNIGTGADGGFLVPEPFFDRIWRVAEQASVYLARATRVPITIGNRLLPISLATDVNVFFTAEAAAIQESNPTFAQDPEPLDKLAAFSKWSNELMEDEEVGLVDFISTLFGEAMGAKIDNEGFDGDGTNFVGILNKVGVNTVVMPTGDISFNDINTENLSDLIDQLTTSVLTGSSYYLHRTVFGRIRRLKDSEGQPVFAPPGGDQPSTIYGWPFTVVDQMPSTASSAPATPFVIFGNLMNAIWGAKGEMTVRVTDIPEILNDQTIMVVRRRIATNTANPPAFSVLETAAS